MNIYLGIDFGAENIYVSYKRRDNDIVEFLPCIDGDNNYFKNYYAIDNKKRDYFGMEAADRAFDPDITFYSKYKQYIAKPEKEWPEMFKELSPEAIMCKVLAHLRNVIDIRLKAQYNTDKVIVDACVVTVPYGWQNNSTCKRVYRKAIEKAEFKNFRLVDEPTAAAANVIAVARNMLFNEQQQPKEGDNVMVVDIGASTIDVSICANGNPIRAFEGTSTFDAGNQIDMKLLSTIAEIEYEEIVRSPKKYLRPMEKAQQLKHMAWARIRRMHNSGDPDRILGKEAKSEHFKKVAECYANRVADIIGDVLERFSKRNKNTKISFLVICGGMSEYDHANFPTALFDKIRSTAKNYFESCVFMNQNKEISRDLRQRTIANGAAMLAKDPRLVLQKLGRNVYVRLEHKGYYLPILMIPEDTILGENKEIKLWDAVQNHPEFHSGIKGLTAERLIGGESLRVSINDEEYDEIAFNFDEATKKAIRHSSGKNRERRDDLVGYLNNDGAISFKIIDRNGKVISFATFKKAEASILRM